MLHPLTLKLSMWAAGSGQLDAAEVTKAMNAQGTKFGLLEIMSSPHTLRPKPEN